MSVKRLIVKRPPPRPTAKEQQILDAISRRERASRFGAKDIARDLGISVYAVWGRIENLKAKGLLKRNDLEVIE